MTRSKLLSEKSFFYTIFNMYLFENSENNRQFFIIINHVFEMFILMCFFRNNLNTLRYLAKYLSFGSNVIQTNQNFNISKTLSDLFIFSLRFSKKELRNSKIRNKVTKQNSYIFKATTFLRIFLVLIFARLTSYLINQDEHKPSININNSITQFLKKPKIPLFCLNNNYIIWCSGLVCESENIGQGRSYVDNNIKISNCFFSRFLTYSGKGGVIYVSVSSYSMNINYTMFYNCVCSNDGGAIYYYSTDSCLRMICANSCSCGSEYPGHLAYLKASQMNQVEYLSEANCSHTTSGYYPIYLYTGYQRVENTNSSMNKAAGGSGFGIESPSSFTSSHCTFSNNKVSDSICLYFFSDTGQISMSYANIVHNNSPSQYGVVFAYEASPKMIYCIFCYNRNTLFCVYSGSLEVSHSFIGHSGKFSVSTAVSTSNNNTLINRITYQLQFFHSLHCNADIPLLQRSIGETSRMSYKRTIDQTISETQKETIHRTIVESIFTYQMANNRVISDIFSFVFIYTVIFQMIT